MRAAPLSVILVACAAAALVGAPQSGPTTLCERLAFNARGNPTTRALSVVWSQLTTGAAPITIATVSELSLQRDPAPDERVQFEKRFRALYGNAEAVLKDLNTWDGFDILTLQGSAVRMLLTTSGPAACESRYFFRVTVSREVVRVPNPPAADGANDAETPLCEKQGGWGYFARVSGTDAFIERRTAADAREFVRVVPLTSAGWQPACTLGPPAHGPS